VAPPLQLNQRRPVCSQLAGSVGALGSPGHVCGRLAAAAVSAQQLHYIGCWHCNTPAALKELQLYMLLALQYRAVAALQAHFG
jgi:hypothetical protein